jgi:hypothetical protein
VRQGEEPELLVREKANIKVATQNQIVIVCGAPV